MFIFLKWNEFEVKDIWRWNSMFLKFCFDNLFAYA